MTDKLGKSGKIKPMFLVSLPTQRAHQKRHKITKSFAPFQMFSINFIPIFLKMH